MLLSDVCLLTSVCLSRTSGLNREQRGLGRLNLAQSDRCSTWLGHHFPGQGHQTTLVGCTGRPTWTYSNGDLSICVHDVYRVTTCRAGLGHIVAAARLQLVWIKLSIKFTINHKLDIMFGLIPKTKKVTQWVYKKVFPIYFWITLWDSSRI